MKCILILLLIFSISICSFSQEPEISISKEVIKYEVNMREYKSLCVVIKNNSTEDIYVWLNKLGYKSKNQDLITEYFLKLNGDFKLIDLLSDKLVDSFETILFKTFIKRIPPKEKFQIILNAKPATKEWKDNILDNKIVYFKSNEIPSPYLEILDSSKDILFQNDKIVLDVKIFQ